MRKQKFIDQLSCKISEMMRKKIENGRLVAILYFITAKFVMCETLHFVLYSWSSYFAFFLISQNYTDRLEYSKQPASVRNA